MFLKGFENKHIWNLFLTWRKLRKKKVSYMYFVAWRFNSRTGIPEVIALYSISHEELEKGFEISNNHLQMTKELEDKLVNFYMFRLRAQIENANISLFYCDETFTFADFAILIVADTEKFQRSIVKI